MHNNSRQNNVDRLVGANISLIRRGAGFSTSYVARNIGESELTLHAIESGVIRAGAERLLVLSKILGVLPSEFLRDRNRHDGRKLFITSVVRD